MSGGTPKDLSAPDERLCAYCKGMGWLYVYRNGKPGTPELSAHVPCPVCGQQTQLKYLESICGLNPEMRSMRFDGTRRTEANGAAIDALLALVRQPQWCLTLTGNYGVGKTRLLACLVNAGIDLRWISIYVTMAALLDLFRRAYAPDAAVSYDSLLELFVNARILAIDELDRFNPTPWAQEKLFELVDTRYREGGSKLTAFATNAPLDQLPGYLVSRLRDVRCKVFEVRGPDLRRV